MMTPGALLLAALVVGAASAPESPPVVRLNYERGPGAARCPDQSALQRGVAARLGRDPFNAEALTVIHARIVGEGEGLRGLVQVREGARELGAREVSSASKDCAELASSLELILAIAIDPFSLAVAPPPASEPVEPAPPAPLEPPSPPAEPAAPPEPEREGSPAPPGAETELSAGAGLMALYGSAPSLTGGALVRLEVRRGAGALGLEGRADLAGTRTVGEGRISTSLLQAMWVGCFLMEPFRACALVGAGALRGSGVGFAEEGRATTPYVAFGGRATWRTPLSDVLNFRVDVDLTAPLTRTTLLVSGREVWSTAPLCVAAGIGVDADFL